MFNRRFHARSAAFIIGVASLTLTPRSALKAQQPPDRTDGQANGAASARPAGAGDEPIRVNVDLVNILFTVKDKKGHLITDLQRESFQIREDGKPQSIQRFSKETDLPLTLGLLIDISASQEALIDIERRAASQFFTSVVRQKDEAFVISFGKETVLLQDFTNSPRRLTASLDELRGDGPMPMVGRGPIPNVNTGPIGNQPMRGTLLYDAIYLAANEKLRQEVGRKALVLITDGEDQGSTYKRREAIEQAQKSDAIVFSIFYVDQQFYHSFGAGGGDYGELKKISEETGGQVFTVSDKHPLSEVFTEIQDELRTQYAIGYSPTNPKRDGSFRRIQITTDKKEHRVQARAGYYATANETP